MGSERIEIEVNITPFRADNPLIEKAQAYLKEEDQERALECIQGLMHSGKSKIEQSLSKYGLLESSEIKLTSSTFANTDELAFNVSIKGVPRKQFDYVKGLFAEYAGQEEQKNFHIVEYSQKPSDIDYGVLQKGGFTYEACIVFEFTNPLNEQEKNTLQNIIRGINLEGSQLTDDNKTLTVYNITKISNEEEFGKKGQALFRGCMEAGLSCEVCAGDEIKLWNYGEKAFGATRSIEEVAYFYQRTGSKAELTHQLKKVKATDPEEILKHLSTSADQYNAFLDQLNQQSKYPEKVHLSEILFKNGYEHVHLDGKHLAVNGHHKVDITTLYERTSARNAQIDHYKRKLAVYNEVITRELPPKKLGFIPTQERRQILKAQHQAKRPVNHFDHFAFQPLKKPAFLNAYKKESKVISMNISNQNSRRWGV